MPVDFQSQHSGDIHDRRHHLRTLLRKYDKDKSGNLNADELKELIKSHGDAHQGPVEPSEEEIWLIIQAAGRHTRNCVDASEIQFALDLWHSYITNRDKINAIFEKYDTNHTERMEVAKLSRYLTELNDGHPPTVLRENYTKSHKIAIYAVL
jgi:Ca2+-binding EF-hand superfamily protein